jgi:hypothetical protein
MGGASLHTRVLGYMGRCIPIYSRAWVYGDASLYTHVLVYMGRSAYTQLDGYMGYTHVLGSVWHASPYTQVLGYVEMHLHHRFPKYMGPSGVHTGEF